MKKKDFLKAIAKDTGLTIKTSQIALNSILNNIIKATTENEKKIRLPGFGTFEKIIRNPRTCRNPQTGETMKIGTRAGVKFKAGTFYKKAVATSSDVA